MPLVQRALLPFATAAIAAGIFIFDTLTPLEVAAGTLYVAVVLLAVRFLDTSGVLLVAAGCVVLMIVSFFLTQHTGSSVSDYVNLLIGIAATALATYLALID